MAGFGGLGGLGGSSFPQRFGAPNSQEVGFMPTALDWRADWQRRYDEEAARAGSTVSRMVQLIPGQLGYDEDAASPYHAQIRDTAAKYGVDFATTPYASGSATGGSHAVQEDVAYTPNFTGLEDERTRMTPIMEGQQRQQQSYDQMRGWNQMNGVMGPGYTDPNFGQVTGDFGQNSMGANAHAAPGTGGMSGVDPSWTSGIFDPSGGLSGVYGPNTTAKKGFL